MIKKKIIFDRFFLKRKNWLPEITEIVVNKKHIIYVNKAYNFSQSGLFVRNYNFNYKYYLFFLSQFKKKNTTYLYKHYLNSSKYFILHPSYDFSSKYFTNFILFKDILLENGIKGFFVKNYYIRNYINNNINVNILHGLNFYVHNFSEEGLSKINILTQDKDYQNIINIKYMLIDDKNKDDFSKFSMIHFNLCLLNVLELYNIYKILLYNNISIIINKYI